MIETLARAKFRFDLGQSFLSAVNLTLLTISASGHISGATGLPIRWVVVGGVPLVLLSVWGFGYALDRLAFFRAYQSEMNARNDLLQRIAER